MTAPGIRETTDLLPIDPEAHLDAVWRLARERDRAALGRVETTRSWIEGRLTAPGANPRSDARMRLGPDGEPVGAVWVSRTSGVAGRTAELVLGPHATVSDGVELLSFAERRCREADAVGTELSCFVSAEEHTAREALRRCGFGSPRAYHRMAVALDGDLPSIDPAPGVVVRPPRGEEDMRAFHRVKNGAFSAEEAGKEEDGFAAWLRWWRADPGVDPAQCALLELEGSAVGFANVTDRMRDSRDAAYVRQIGVVPEARRRGLGRRLLLSTMHEARRRGRSAMVLTVDAANLPAFALYRGLGWEVEARFDDFHRTIAVDDR